MIKIHIRDTNGKKNCIVFALWDNVCSYVAKHIDTLENEEILLITYDDICIYSQLGNDPIDWEDITGFFG